MAARKEALMQSVRGEMALANAQELLNVRKPFLPFPFIILTSTLEKQRKMLRQVCHEAFNISVRFRRGTAVI